MTEPEDTADDSSVSDSSSDSTAVSGEAGNEPDADPGSDQWTSLDMGSVAMREGEAWQARDMGSSSFAKSSDPEKDLSDSDDE